MPPKVREFTRTSGVFHILLTHFFKKKKKLTCLPEYKMSWSTTYGLLSVANSNGKVTHACCRFCKAFSKEEKACVQRGHIIQHTQFTPKWCTDDLISHLKNIHLRMRQAYKTSNKHAMPLKNCESAWDILQRHFICKASK